MRREINISLSVKQARLLREYLRPISTSTGYELAQVFDVLDKHLKAEEMLQKLPNLRGRR